MSDDLRRDTDMTKVPLDTRLRYFPITNALRKEAADEIERLRKIEQLYRPTGGHQNPHYPADGFVNDYD